MTVGTAFSEFLVSSLRGWSDRKSDGSILSLALSVNGVDSLLALPQLSANQQFRFLWDQHPDQCLSAAGRCQHLDLSGPNRFENAQRFSDETFSQIIDISVDSPHHANPKILFAFSFFEQILKGEKGAEETFAVQAVLPRWQLSASNGSVWLRLSAIVNDKSDAREMAEQLWMMREKLEKEKKQVSFDNNLDDFIHLINRDWEALYREDLEKGIELVNSGELEKLVLAVRKLILLKEPLDPLKLLFGLRSQKGNSCRFLWQQSNEEAFFGASPERLIGLDCNELFIDALAGTAKKDDDGQKLINSTKDLREHSLVVDSIMNQLSTQGLNAHAASKPTLMRQGHLIHLHTPISAKLKAQTPLSLVKALHPTPAVSGLPQKLAMNWLRALESFERGLYASPVGWIDLAENAEFRVAIRCGNMRGNQLELFAGAGLVKGSTVEGELSEVTMKLNVLSNQLVSH